MKVIIFLIVQTSLLAASCCGGGGGSQNLILNDAAIKLSLAYSNTTYLSDIDSKGSEVQRKKSGLEIKEVVSLGYAKSFLAYHQAGLELNGVKITKGEGATERSEINPGDLKFFYGYEVFPETYYSIWKPRGFASFVFNIPLGNSKYDYETTAGEDISSSGFYSLSANLVLLKVYGRHQLLLSFGGVGTFTGDTGKGKVERDLGYNVSGSYSFSSLYDFADLSFTIGRDVIGKDKLYKDSEVIESSNSIENFASISLSHEVNEENAISLTYKDTVNFGGQKNISTYKLISVNYLHYSF
ncbi:hypothetical protein [Bacteriovorax sp. Seq25_V]|uniref:hypothetical protein n=1 Tax=Bacteriovorax sp. Seq25_V TaxID=1201288 RepID=UPI0018E005C1|nr:hypothetical protein [Bacteriovorax sp. Seq25_V]